MSAETVLYDCQTSDNIIVSQCTETIAKNIMQNITLKQNLY